MTSVGAYEAKTHLPRLLEQVESGATFTITRHGREIARLVPVDRPAGDAGEVITAIREARAQVRRGRDSVRRMRDEGRR